MQVNSWIPKTANAEAERENAMPDVLQMLVDYIRDEELNVGERLPSIRELAGRWNLRPHVVRDGVLHAQQLGLIEVRPQAGIFVQKPSIQQAVHRLQSNLTVASVTTDEGLLELMEARRVLETELAGLAAQRARVETLLPLRHALEEMDRSVENRADFIVGDENFHLQIARLAGNKVLLMVLQGFLEMLHPIKEQLHAGQKSVGNTQEDHRHIYQLLSKGDVEGSRAAMREHLTYEPDWIFSLLDGRRKAEENFI